MQKPRREYELRAEQAFLLTQACKKDAHPDVVKVRANEVWEGIGADMGFDPKTVEPIRGTQKYTAIPLPDAPDAD
jgi:hypothetical protein